MKSTTKYAILLPVLFSFFVTGFVDVVGIATSYVKADFNLNNKLANLLPMMVFLWFAVCSLPTGMLMSRMGRKKTVILSGAITFVAMLLPLIDYSFTICLLTFALLGIGNTILQVSLNPLLMNVTDKSHMTSMLTLGQFIKAISSTLGPVIVGIAVSYFGDWKLIFPIYAFFTLLSWVWLFFTKIPESKIENNQKESSKVWSLFKDPYLLMLLSLIVLIVGFEIGLMTAIPKYLLERCDLPLDKGGLGCSLYYIARTIGTFIGAIILVKVSAKKFLIWTMLVSIIALVVFISFDVEMIVLSSLFVMGLMCANVFAIVFSSALQYSSKMANEISALMIMGIAGGALIPPIMGVVADMSSELTSLFVLLAALVYIFIVSFKLKTN